MSVKQKIVTRIVTYNQQQVHFEYDNLKIYALIHAIAMKGNKELWRKFLNVNVGNVIPAFLCYIAYCILHLSAMSVEYYENETLIEQFRKLNPWYAEVEKKNIFKITYSDSLFADPAAYRVKKGDNNE